MTGHWSELELRRSLVRQTTKVKQSNSQSEDGSTELSHPLLEGMVTHDWLFDNPLLYETTQDERSSCQQYIVYFIFLDTLNQKCHIYIFIYTHYLGLQWGVVASFRGSMYSLGMRLGEWPPSNSWQSTFNNNIPTAWWGANCHLGDFLLKSGDATQ